MEELDKAMDTLSEMLSSDEGKQTLSNMVSSLTESAQENSGNELFNIETMLKLKGAIDEIEHNNDNRSNLLLALKPFLNQTRLGRIDETINLLKIAKLPSVLKGIRR